MPYASKSINGNLSNTNTLTKPIKINSLDINKLDIQHQDSSDILYSNSNIPPSNPFTFTPPDDSYLKNLYLNYISYLKK